MLIIHWKLCLLCVGGIEVFILFSALYTYLVNTKRASDDPEKRDFSPHAIWLAPIALPFLIVFNIFAWIMYSLLFSLLLIIFTFMLLLIRKPFLIKWILKQAQRIGSKLLKINTALLRAAGLYTPPLRPST